MSKINADNPAEAKDARPLWFTRRTLQKAFVLAGCVICRAVRSSERKGIHSFLYESMMSPIVRGNFLTGGGFCARHFWMAREIEEETWPEGGIGLAILCEDLMRSVTAGLKNVGTAEPSARDSWFHHRATHEFIPGHDCIFCEENIEKEMFLAEVLEELMDEQEFAKPLAKNGLCARHGQLALKVWKNATKREELLDILKKQADELAADLREFIRKHDYQHKNDPKGREVDSVLRAQSLLVGNAPWDLFMERGSHENCHHL